MGRLSVAPFPHHPPTPKKKSGYLKKHKEEFAPFIEGGYATVEEFCAKEVEPVNRECEQVRRRNHSPPHAPTCIVYRSPPTVLLEQKKRRNQYPHLPINQSHDTTPHYPNRFRSWPSPAP